MTGRLIYFLTLALMAAWPFSTRAETPGAGSICDSHLATIMRALPEPGHKAQKMADARKTVLALRQAITQDTTTQAARDAGSLATQYPAAPSVYEVGDGHRIRYRYGTPEQRNAKISPEDYRALFQRAKATETELGKLVEHSPDKVAILHLTNPEAIRELLETAEKVREKSMDKEQAKALEMKCLITGAVAGLAAGGVKAATTDPNASVANRIADKVKEKAVMTKEQHFEMLEKILLGPDAYDRERAKKMLAEHRRELEELEKLDIQVHYGARIGDYKSIRSYNLDKGEMERLAQKNRDLSPERLQKEAWDAFRRDPSLDDYRKDSYSRSGFDVEELREYLKSEVGQVGYYALKAGDVLAGAGLGGLAGFLACGKAGGIVVGKVRDLVRPPVRVPAANLEEIRAAFENAMRPPVVLPLGGAKTVNGLPVKAEPLSAGTHEIYWDGSQTANGQHSDFILQIERGSNPPKISLTGLSYQMPVDYFKPLSDAELAAALAKNPPIKLRQNFPDPKTIDLREYQHVFIAEHFPLVFGEESLKPLRSLFRNAFRMKLSESEMTTFLTELDQVKDLKQLKNMESLLLDLYEARNKAATAETVK